MGEPAKAVFLSYASQDAAAVARICDALRAAGVEVWFDQNELTGGDAWDQKIRKQIKECALFVPVISANTNARREGYFRREWKLAVDRTHDMDEALPFLVPVVIDGTTDAGAFVPEKFREVQWTRLPGGETPEKFCARVRRLLEGESSAPSPAKSETSGAGRRGRHKTASPASNSSVPRWAGVAVGVVAIATAAYLTLRPRPKADEGARISAPAPVDAVKAKPEASGVETKAQQLIAQARALYEPWRVATGEDLRLADRLLVEATELEPANAEGWASLAVLSVGMRIFGFDLSESRRTLLINAAERAVKLGPASRYAQLAVAMRYRFDPATADEADRIFRRLSEEPEVPPFVLRAALRNMAARLREKGAPAEGLPLLLRAAALPGGDPNAEFEIASTLLLAGRYEEAVAADDRALALRPDFGAAQAGKLVILLVLLGDLDRTRAALQQIPDRALRDPRVTSMAVYIWFLAGEHKKAEDLLRMLPGDYLESEWVYDPKARLAGLIHDRAGRKEAAMAVWRLGLRAVEKRLEANPTERRELANKAVLLALLGDRQQAEEIVRLIDQLGQQPGGQASPETWLIYATLGREEVVADYFERTLRAEAARPGLSFTPGEFKIEPALDAFRSKPRFVALTREVDKIFAARAAVGGGSGPASAEGSEAKADAKSIAVLPFANLSADKEATGYFADGVHADIHTSLVGIRDLKVVSRSSVLEYRETAKKSAQIGRELRVTYLLQGSVQRAGQQVRVSAQLIRAASDDAIWAKNFTRDLSDIFAIQSEVAQAIAAELKATLSPEEKERLAERPTSNMAAYDLFLKARKIHEKGGRMSREEVAQRVSLAEAAVAMDPKFVEAWSELADAHVGMYAGSLDTSPGRLAKAREALSRARALDPESPAYRRAQGAYYLFGDGEGAKAIEQYELILTRQPNDVDCLEQLSVAQRLIGRWSDALRSARRLVQLEPGNARRVWGMINLLVMGRRYEEAKTLIREMPRSDENDIALATLDFWSTGSREPFDRIYDRLVSGQRDFWLVRQEMGLRAFERGDFAEYERLMGEESATGSFEPELHRVMQVALARKLRGDAAGVKAVVGRWPATLRARLALEPDNTQWLRALAMLAAAEENYDEALRCIDHAAQLLPFQKDSQRAATIREVRALIFVAMGDRNRAVAQLAELLQHPSIRLNVHGLARYPGFASLREDAGFQALLRDPKNNAPLF